MCKWLNAVRLARNGMAARVVRRSPSTVMVRLRAQKLRLRVQLLRLSALGLRRWVQRRSLRALLMRRWVLGVRHRGCARSHMYMNFAKRYALPGPAWLDCVRYCVCTRVVAHYCKVQLPSHSRCKQRVQQK